MRPVSAKLPQTPPEGPVPNPKATKILEAAREVFLEHGFTDATSDMIQQAAGVSKATVYAHFANKEALFIAAIEYQCNRFLAQLRQAAFTQSHIRDTLTQIGQTYLAMGLSPVGLATVRVVTAAAPRFPELARTFYMAGPRVVCDIISQHLSAAAKRGEIDISSIGPETAANQFFSLVRGEGQLECMMHPQSRPSAAQLDYWTRTAVDTFMRAYGPR